MAWPSSPPCWTAPPRWAGLSAIWPVIPAALFAESPHLSDAELDELDAIINAAEDETKGGKS